MDGCIVTKNDRELELKGRCLEEGVGESFGKQLLVEASLHPSTINDNVLVEINDHESHVLGSTVVGDESNQEDGHWKHLEKKKKKKPKLFFEKKYVPTNARKGVPQGALLVKEAEDMV